MIATVGVISALLIAALAIGLARERHLRHRAENQAASLETQLSEMAEARAAEILARRNLDLPPRQEPPHSRRLQAAPVTLAAGLAAVAGWARDRPRLAGAALAATTAGLIAVPLILPADPQPRPEPPPASAPPPVEQYALPEPALGEADPDVGRSEPEPDRPEPAEPAPGDDQSDAATEAPEMEQVAEVQPAPAKSSPPGRSDPPEPSPAPEPDPEPSPTPDPEPTDPLLLCLELDSLDPIYLELCV